MLENQNDGWMTLGKLYLQDGLLARKIILVSDSTNQRFNDSTNPCASINETFWTIHQLTKLVIPLYYNVTSMNLTSHILTIKYNQPRNFMTYSSVWLIPSFFKCPTIFVFWAMFWWYENCRWVLRERLWLFKKYKYQFKYQLNAVKSTNEC